jgi:hypothetical protein
LPASRATVVLGLANHWCALPGGALGIQWSQAILLKPPKYSLWCVLFAGPFYISSPKQVKCALQGWNPNHALTLSSSLATSTCMGSLSISQDTSHAKGRAHQSPPSCPASTTHLAFDSVLEKRNLRKHFTKYMEKYLRDIDHSRWLSFGNIWQIETRHGKKDLTHTTGENDGISSSGHFLGPNEFGLEFKFCHLLSVWLGASLLTWVAAAVKWT